MIYCNLFNNRLYDYMDSYRYKYYIMQTYQLTSIEIISLFFSIFVNYFINIVTKIEESHKD